MKSDITRYHKWIREQPCVNCLAAPPSECSHYQGMSGRLLDKGMGQKANHLAVVPHCRECHVTVEARRMWGLPGESPFIQKLSHSEGMAIQIIRTIIEAHKQGVINF